MDPAYHNNPPMSYHPEIETFRKHFIQQKPPSCPMARTLLGTELAKFGIYDHLGSFPTARKMLQDITAFLAISNPEADTLHSFVAVFKGEKDYCEMTFELLMWQQLQALQETDNNTGWDAGSGDHQEDRDFSFNVTGKTFKVVGMHPQNSCMARRSPLPALVFYPHSQFEKLREQEEYEHIRQKMRQRKLKHHDSIDLLATGAQQHKGKPQNTGRCSIDTSTTNCPMR